MIFISCWHRRIAAALAVILAAAAGPAAALQQADVAQARRIADIATIALAEYAEGVSNGRIVQMEEWNEARLFINEARQSAETLPGPARHRVVPILERLMAGVVALQPESQLDRELAALRRELERAVGAALDPLPSRAPSLARGASLYREYCTQCHGDAGAGDGQLAGGLKPPPADLTDLKRLRLTSPLEFFRKINVGVAGTAMPGFAAELGLEDRWSLALYASTLRFSLDAQGRGRELLPQRCSDCALLLSDFEATSGLSDDSLVVLLSNRVGPLADPADGDAMLAYARAAAALEELGGDKILEAERTVALTKSVAAEARRLAEAGDRRAAVRRAVDGYLVFERIESAVRARDASSARRVERAFAEYRAALESAGAAARWEGAQLEVNAALGAALDGLKVQTAPTVLFGQSFIILLREGLEAILIIGALAAFLSRAGAPERKHELGVGVLAALGASVLTAVGFATLFRSATAHQEILEGVTMLLAALVLFWVSYWLVSKIELRKWQAFVHAQMQKALGSKRAVALGAVAFLAVYREGFETVLFYAALITTSDRSPAALSAVAAGLVVAAAVLGVVYYAMQRYGVRLPLKPFFGITSAFLYVMAFSFAGQGVAELQDAGVISATPLGWLPAVPALGIFPTIQTVLSQLVLAVALVGALLWVFWLEPRVSRAAVSA